MSGQSALEAEISEKMPWVDLPTSNERQITPEKLLPDFEADLRGLPVYGNIRDFGKSTGADVWGWLSKGRGN